MNPTSKVSAFPTDTSRCTSLVYKGRSSRALLSVVAPHPLSVPIMSSSGFVMLVDTEVFYHTGLGNRGWFWKRHLELLSFPDSIC